MKKIALFIGFFSTNGVSINRITLAREFLRMGYQVDFVVCQNTGASKDSVPQECNIFELGSTRPRNMVSLIGKYLQSERPDGMIVASWPFTAVAIVAKSLYMRSLCLVVSEHSHFREAPEMTKKDRFILKYFSRWIYKMATKVVAVSEGTKEGLSEVTGLNLKEIKVIYNPLRTMPSSKFLAEDRELADWWRTSRKLLAVGRLEKAKDFATLLKAFALVASKDNSKLIILGEGGSRNRLQVLIDDLDLSDKVRLPGFRLSTFPFYNEAELFILSSYNEGFGNVVLEALSFGVPVVSTDCLSGPAEILGDGKWGRLAKVGSPEDLAEKMLLTLNECHDKNELIERSRFFSPPRIAQEYIDTLFPQ